MNYQDLKDKNRQVDRVLHMAERFLEDWENDIYSDDEQELLTYQEALTDYEQIKRLIRIAPMLLWSLKVSRFYIQQAELLSSDKRNAWIEAINKVCSRLDDPLE